MINNGAKSLQLSLRLFSQRISKPDLACLPRREVNRVWAALAAPTAVPVALCPVCYTRFRSHHVDEKKILEAMLLAAGIARSWNRRRALQERLEVAGSKRGPQARWVQARLYCMGGSTDQIFNAVAVTVQCMLGLVCDPVAGLVESPLRGAQCKRCRYCEQFGINRLGECQ